MHGMGIHNVTSRKLLALTRHSSLHLQLERAQEQVTDRIGAMDSESEHESTVDAWIQLKKAADAWDADKVTNMGTGLKVPSSWRQCSKIECCTYLQ